MIERHGEVNQGLEKEAMRAAHGPPQIFERLVALKVRAAAV
jgi:hypothetical protein